MEPEETKPAEPTSDAPAEPTNDVFISPHQEVALARQINTEGTKLFKLTIGEEKKYIVAKTRHRALMSAVDTYMSIDQVSEKDLMRMLRQSFPDLVHKAGEARQVTLPFSNEEN